MKLNEVAKGFFIALLLTPNAHAEGQNPTSEEILRALKPTEITRSWSRGISVEDADKPKRPPSVDLYLNFEFDSDVLDTDSSIVLDSLGAALSNNQLDGFQFLIAGHTDAKGTDEYNFDLSHRRAESVRSYLLNRFPIANERLKIKGYGESQLLDPQEPEGAINRRVQIVNMFATDETN